MRKVARIRLAGMSPEEPRRCCAIALALYQDIGDTSAGVTSVSARGGLFEEVGERLLFGVQDFVRSHAELPRKLHGSE